MGTDCVHGVMAGLVPAIHAFPRSTKNVDARDKPGHDDLCKIQMRFPAACGERAITAIAFILS
ncbi:hypothetical protein GCM10007858_09280 [Bradyrhizobium liaoningense]|nr:hypothetical protein GCM10007858_09280 [Bradyrhizobium liaoningense]